MAAALAATPHLSSSASAGQLGSSASGRPAGGRLAAASILAGGLHHQAATRFEPRVLLDRVVGVLGLAGGDLVHDPLRSGLGLQ